MPAKSKIQDQTFLFTGTLTEFTREEAEALVEANGGKVLSGVSTKLVYLVVGQDAGSKLEKAKALGTVKILTEKQFLKMVPNSETKPAISSKSSTAPSAKPNKLTGKSGEKALPSVAATFRNEIILKGTISELKKIIKKHDGKDTYEEFDEKINLIDTSKSNLSFHDLTSDDKSVFYVLEKEGRLIVNSRIESSYLQIDMTEDFFKDLSKISVADFKLSFINKDSWTLVFCAYNNGELLFESSSVSDWEDIHYFDDIPYFVKLAKSRGMKKKKDEDGEKVWDSEEVYELIYEFRDGLASGDDTYLNLAPDWYISMKSISN